MKALFSVIMICCVCLLSSNTIKAEMLGDFLTKSPERFVAALEKTAETYTATTTLDSGHDLFSSSRNFLTLFAKNISTAKKKVDYEMLVTFLHDPNNVKMLIDSIEQSLTESFTSKPFFKNEFNKRWSSLAALYIVVGHKDIEKGVSVFYEKFYRSERLSPICDEGELEACLGIFTSVYGNINPYADVSLAYVVQAQRIFFDDRRLWFENINRLDDMLGPKEVK